MAKDKVLKVFLGGTCSGWKWRNEFQKMLHCNYYNPIVKNWSEKDRLREVKEREESDYVVYCITNGIKGVYSIAEVVDDSHKRPDKVIFINLYKEKDDKESKQMSHSLKAVENLLRDNGIRVYSGSNALKCAADFLNSMNDKLLNIDEKHSTVDEKHLTPSDLLSEDNDYIEFYDNVFDIFVGLDYVSEKDLNREADKYYYRFLNYLNNNVQVLSVANSTCAWTNFIKKHIKAFKKFTKEHWVRTYKDDLDEFIYQWIKELHLYGAGYVSESEYKALVDMLIDPSNN